MPTCPPSISYGETQRCETGSAENPTRAYAQMRAPRQCVRPIHPHCGCAAAAHHSDKPHLWANEPRAKYLHTHQITMPPMYCKLDTRTTTARQTYGNKNKTRNSMHLMLWFLRDAANLHTNGTTATRIRLSDATMRNLLLCALQCQTSTSVRCWPDQYQYTHITSGTTRTLCATALRAHMLT